MACATLYTYCVYELRMSEDEAQRRCRAARLCRQFPLLLAMLADASIHLTGILLLGPQISALGASALSGSMRDAGTRGLSLTDENHGEILARARYRTKREIEKLVAEIAPRDDVPARIEPLHVAPRARADHTTMMAALCGPVRNLPAGNGRGEAPVGALAELELADETSVPLPQTARPVAEPPLTSAMHYKVQFTADQDYMSLLEEARDLLAHVNPTRDFVEVQRKALEVLVAQLRKRKHAARAGAEPESTEPSPETSDDNHADAPSARRPANDTTSASSKRTRRPTAAIARAVWQRDQSRCTYVDERGQPCRETSMLEYHHEQAWALGGGTTVSNLSLRCRAHNALARRRTSGRSSSSGSAAGPWKVAMSDRRAGAAVATTR
jgi:hypothetical protein